MNGTDSQSSEKGSIVRICWKRQRGIGGHDKVEFRQGWMSAGVVLNYPKKEGEEEEVVVVQGG